MRNAQNGQHTLRILVCLTILRNYKLTSLRDFLGEICTYWAWHNKCNYYRNWDKMVKEAALKVLEKFYENWRYSFL